MPRLLDLFLRILISASWHTQTGFLVRNLDLKAFE
jgi:hypothetical protein